MAQRYGFKDRWTRNFLLTAYFVSVGTGIYGFVEQPPASVQTVLEYSFFALLWDFAFLAAGLLGLFGRMMEAPRTELIAVEIFAGTLIVWAVMTFLTPQSDQAGLALVTAALFIFGWAAGTRRYWARQEKDLNELRRD